MKLKTDYEDHNFFDFVKTIECEILCPLGFNIMILSFSSLAALKFVKVLQIQLQNCLFDIIIITIGTEDKKNALHSDQLYHYTLCQK